MANTTDNAAKRKFKKRYLWLGLILLIIALRIALPYIIIKYVNKTLADLDGYSGEVYDVDLYLYRGAYTICDMRIDMVNNEVKEPFVQIPLIDLSVEWSAIFKGRIVGEVEVYDPVINFAFGPTEAASQTGETVDWVEVVTDLMPININRFAVVNGDINLINVTADPDINARFRDLDMEMTNIRNAESKDSALPSDIKLTGRSSFGGTIEFTAKADLLRDFPDFNYDAKAEGMDLTKFNALTKATAGITIEKGVMDMYSEMTAKDKQLEGYLKPLLHDVSIFSWKEKDRSFGEAIKELFAEGAQELIENRKNWEELTATRIPIKGNADAPDTEIWSTIIGLLVNAYIDRFKGILDGSIEWDDTTNQTDDVREDIKTPGLPQETKEERKAREKKEKEAEKEREKREKEAEKARKKAEND